MEGEWTLFSSDITGRDLVLMRDDGVQIKDIFELDVSFRPNELAAITVTFGPISLNVKGEVVEVTVWCPNCDGVIHQCKRSDSKARKD